ncbi:MAG: glycosyltransferase [Burkholderiales bacterium]
MAVASTSPAGQDLAARLCERAAARLRLRQGAEAMPLLRAAWHAAPASGAGQRALRTLWQAARAAGDWPTALAAAVRAAQAAPSDFPLVHAAVCTLRDAVAAGWRGTRPQVAMPMVLPLLSIVIVSRDDARFAAFEAQCAQAFAAWPHERIRIADATSMYDGYARGFARARGGVVAFAHDDTRFAAPDFAARLADALQDADAVGVAGATRVTSPALLGAGHPWLHGAITHLAQDGMPCEFALLSLAGRRVAGAQALDGVFIAARREWIARVGFDAATCDGFHFYDLDFTYRAHRAGARLAIACDLALLHASRGRMDERYAQAQRRFAARHPELGAAPSAHRHWYALPVADARHACVLHDALLAAWALPDP